MMTVGLTSGGIALAGEAASAAPLAAGCYPSCSTPPGNNSGSNLVTQPPTSAADGGAPAADGGAAASTGALAFTGADVAGTAAAGGAVVVAGLALVRVSRRRRLA